MQTVQRLAASDIRDTAGFQLPEAAENAYLFLFLKSLRHSRLPVADPREIEGRRSERERESAKERMSGEGLFHSHLNSARGANLSWGERPQTRLLPNTGTVSKGDICAGGAAQANIRGKERSYKREATTTRSLGTFVK